MLQLHNLERFNSLIAFSLDGDLKRLKSILKEKTKEKQKYHYVILDTKGDIIIYEKMKGL